VAVVALKNYVLIASRTLRRLSGSYLLVFEAILGLRVVWIVNLAVLAGEGVALIFELLLFRDLRRFDWLGKKPV